MCVGGILTAEGASGSSDAPEWCTIPPLAGVSDDESSGWRVIGLADAAEEARRDAVVRAEVEHDDLVFVVVDEIGERRLEFDAIRFREFAEEHTVLEAIAVVEEYLGHVPTAVVVADVVGNEEAPADHRVVMPV